MSINTKGKSLQALVLSTLVAAEVASATSVPVDDLSIFSLNPTEAVDQNLVLEKMSDSDFNRFTRYVDDLNQALYDFDFYLKNFSETATETQDTTDSPINMSLNLVCDDKLLSGIGRQLSKDVADFIVVKHTLLEAKVNMYQAAACLQYLEDNPDDPAGLTHGSSTAQFKQDLFESLDFGYDGFSHAIKGYLELLSSVDARRLGKIMSVPVHPKFMHDKDMALTAGKYQGVYAIIFENMFRDISMVLEHADDRALEYYLNLAGRLVDLEATQTFVQAVRANPALNGTIKNSNSEYFAKLLKDYSSLALRSSLSKKH